jgi:hypothetical protein
MKKKKKNCQKQENEQTNTTTQQQQHQQQQQQQHRQHTYVKYRILPSTGGKLSSFTLSSAKNALSCSSIFLVSKERQTTT